MAIDDADGSDSGHGEGESATPPGDGTGDPETPGEKTRREVARVDEYTWREFLLEHGHGDAAEELYPEPEHVPGSERWEDDAEDEGPTKPSGADWGRVDVDVGRYLGFHPDDLDPRLAVGGGNATALSEYFESFCDPETTPVVKDEWLWEHYKREYYYDEAGDAPRDADGEKEPFSRTEAVGSGFDPERIDGTLSRLSDRAEELSAVVDERTVDVDGEIDEDAFFTTAGGQTTIANRYDLEKTVPISKKTHFREVERYWVNEPYSFVIIFHSRKENEKKYYVVEPYDNAIEEDLREFLTGKLRTAIKYADEGVVGDRDRRREVIRNRTTELLERYDLYSPDAGDGSGFAEGLADRFGVDGEGDGLGPRLLRLLGWETSVDCDDIEGIAARPEPAVLEDDPETLTEYQVRKLRYYLERDFIGYEVIDGIKHDINVEDVSCDGYDSPVFVYHGDYEQIISNVYHGRESLDDFVVKLAQRSGKGISKRRPQVDATLPDGSRAQLTLGEEVSDHGTNYTIRQFKDVPFTPIDLINWNTFSLEEMAFLWLCIENDKSLIFAGGTASGKTTSLNAVSLFIPSNSKIVSIEDTREVELPQRNWIASVTRPSFSDDEQGDVDEFDLLEAALRQRPDYIVMGEIRGEEGRTAFQVMSTGHTTYTTFHADSVGEVLKRFTTEPINVSKTMFTALDLVSIQTSTRVQGHKVRRNKSLTEINHYDAENDEINVQDVFQWQAETDEFLKMGDSNTFDEIMFDRGWSPEELADQQFRRRVVIAYLIVNGLNTYAQVAATLQAFINDPPTIVGLMARDELETSLEDLREMESVLIDVDPEKEEMVPRPEPTDEVLAEAEEILARAEAELFPEFRDRPTGDVADALATVDAASDVEATPGEAEGLDSTGTDGPGLDAGSEGADELPGGDDDSGPDGRGELSAADDAADETPALGSGPTGGGASAGHDTPDGQDTSAGGDAPAGDFGFGGPSVDDAGDDAVSDSDTSGALDASDTPDAGEPLSDPDETGTETPADADGVDWEPEFGPENGETSLEADGPAYIGSGSPATGDPPDDAEFVDGSTDDEAGDVDGHGTPVPPRSDDAGVADSTDPGGSAGPGSGDDPDDSDDSHGSADRDGPEGTGDWEFGEFREADGAESGRPDGDGGDGSDGSDAGERR